METKNIQILVVDDDKRLRELLQAYLEKQGYTVHLAADALQAKQALDQQDYDLMVLDVMMPGETGVEFAARLRQEECATPILMLTAKGDVEDRISGLEAGADDYLPKPFDPRELLLRVQKQVATRAKTFSPQAMIPLGPLRYDVARQVLLCGDEAVYLTSLETALLTQFAQHPGKTLTRDELAAQGGVSLSPRTVDVQVTRLRKKIEQDPKKPVFLHTVRHKGYVLRPHG